MMSALLLLTPICVILATGETGQGIASIYLQKIHSTGLRAPYKTTAMKNCWPTKSCAIQGSIACFNDPECLSYTKIGEELHLFRNNQCNGGSVALLTRCSCEQNRTYTRGVDICYKVYDTPTKWVEANDTCSIDGGRLLVLDTNDKITWFMDQFEIQGAFWIGARWVSGMMLWLSGKQLPLDSLFWHPGEPISPEDSFVAISSWNNIYGLDDQYSSTEYREPAEMGQLVNRLFKPGKGKTMPRHEEICKQQLA